MTDQELADKIVALGVGIKSMTCVTEGDPFLYLLNKQTPIGFVDKFVRDWRVAGAMMEKQAKHKRTIALSFGCDVFNATDAESATPIYGVYLERPNKSAPRAINEACVEAPQ